MNIYELLNRFWLENEYDPCSATEIALYFFLLNKANIRRWKMPFQVLNGTNPYAVEYD